MVSIKKVAREGDFISVRFREPSRFSTIRTPGWAARVAQTESKGAKVRTGRTSAGNWLVQSVLIRRARGKSKRDARRLARRIQRKIANGDSKVRK